MPKRIYATIQHTNASDDAKETRTAEHELQTDRRVSYGTRVTTVRMTPAPYPRVRDAAAEARRPSGIPPQIGRVSPARALADIYGSLLRSGGTVLFSEYRGEPALTIASGDLFTGVLLGEAFYSLLLQEEARFAEAVWTTLDGPSDLVDIGAGGGRVWAATAAGQLVTAGPGETTLTLFGDQPPVPVRRVSALADGRPVIVGGSGSLPGNIFYLAPGGAWEAPNGDPSASDVAGGSSVAAGNGPVVELAKVDGDAYRQLANLPIWQRIALPTAPSRIAVLPPQTILVAADDGTVFVVSGLSSTALPLAAQATDVGAGSIDEIYVATRSASTDPDLPPQIRAGNTLWRWSQGAQRAHVVKGAGTAIDADDRGQLWVVGADGRAYNRGGRVLGVWPHYPERLDVLNGLTRTPAEMFRDECAIFDPASWENVPAIESPNPIVAETLRLTRDSGASGVVVDLQYFPGSVPEPARQLIAAMTRTWSELGYVIHGFVPVIAQNVGPANLAAAADDVMSYLEVLAAMPGLQDSLRYLSIGNECNLYLDLDLTRWSEFPSFFSKVAQRARELFPRVSVGATMAFQDLSAALASGGPAAAGFASTLSSAGAAMFTFYPSYSFDSGSKLTGPAVAADGFRTMYSNVLYTAGLPVVVQEVGYPASTVDGAASPSAQLEFMIRCFRAWDEAGLRVPFLSWYALHDFHYEGAQCAPFANCASPNAAPANRCGVMDVFASGFNNPAAVGEFFGSTGLWTSNGSARATWSQFRAFARDLAVQGRGIAP